MAPKKVDKLITLKGAKLVTLWRPKGGQTNNSPAYIYIYTYMSERPGCLWRFWRRLQTLACVRTWVSPGPIPGLKRSRPDSPCALFYSVSDPSRSWGGGHPGQSWSHPAPKLSFWDGAWTGQNRLLGHFWIWATERAQREALNDLYLQIARKQGNHTVVPEIIAQLILKLLFCNRLGVQSITQSIINSIEILPCDALRARCSSIFVTSN